MLMTILPLFQWLGQTPVGLAMRHSTYGVAIVEMAHLLALAALGGTILLVDLRLFGIGLKRQPALQLARELSPLFWGSLTVMVVSGTLILSAEPMKYYHNAAFKAKMVLLFLAISFHFTFHQNAVALTADNVSSLWSKSAAALSLTLWLGVGLAGRAIGLL
jgi:hypothetical protein